MPGVMSQIDINAPGDAVWDVMNEPARYPEYAVPVDRMVDLGDGVAREGYTYTEYGGIPPFKSESTWVVTKFEPKTRQVHEGDDGKMRIHLDTRVATVGEGSRLEMRVNMTPRWYMVPLNIFLWPLMMKKRSQDAIDQTVANVKRLAETGS